MNIKRLVMLVILLVGILTLTGLRLYSPSTKAHQFPSNPMAAPDLPAGTTFLSPIRTPLPAVTPTLVSPSPTPTPAPETQLVLEYIARREGIPVERLRAGYEMRREHPLLGRAFWAVKAEEVGRDHYMALMDLADGSFYDDEEALIDAEAEAYLEQYGKLDPDLYEREDVGLIYLIAEQGSEATDTAIPTDRVPTVWARTFSGCSGLVAVAAVWGFALPLIYLSRRAGGSAGKRLLWTIFVAATVLSLPLLYLAACRPKEIELPFETIEQRQAAGTGELWEAREPGLMVIAAPDDLAQIDNLFTKDAQAQLREVDFDAYFALAVFLGWQPSSHGGVQMERVVRRGDEVSVHVQVGKPGGAAEATSPYHLVKVRKEGNWGRRIRFTLYLDGTSTTSLSQFIP